MGAWTSNKVLLSFQNWVKSFTYKRRPLSRLFFLFGGQFSTSSFTAGIFQTISGVVARSIIHLQNTSAFSDLSLNASAVIISRLHRSIRLPFRAHVRRKTRSSCRMPLLRIARIFAYTAEVNTPNKSAIWFCVSQTPLAVGQIVTCPFSMVMGRIVIIVLFYRLLAFCGSS